MALTLILDLTLPRRVGRAAALLRGRARLGRSLPWRASAMARRRRRRRRRHRHRRLRRAAQHRRARGRTRALAPLGGAPTALP